MTKPGVNWKDIERRYKTEVLHGDLSVRQLAKDGGVSHVTLLRRAERQGWKPGSLTAARKAISTTNTAEIFAKPRSELTKGEKRQVTFGNACPENAARILADVERGMSQAVAARSVGLTPEALVKWKKRDPEFGTQLDAADARSIGETQVEVVQASERGDMKASIARLQTHRFTRADWGRGGGGISPTVAIQLNIERGTHTMSTPVTAG